MDHYRRSSRHLTVPLEQGTELLEMDAALTPEQVVLRQEEQDRLLGAIRQLPPLQQEVLRLRFVAGLRAAEMASLLGKREIAVRKLLSRTLNLLRSRYIAAAEDTEPGRKQAL